MAKRLFTTLADYYRTHPMARARVRQKPFSSDEIEQLRVLGYEVEGDREALNPGYEASAAPHDQNPEE